MKMRRVILSGLTIAMSVVGCEHARPTEALATGQRALPSVRAGQCARLPVPPTIQTNTRIAGVFNASCGFIYLLTGNNPGQTTRTAIPPQTILNFYTNASNPSITFTCVSDVSDLVPNSSWRCINGVFGSPPTYVVDAPLMIYNGPPSPAFAATTPAYVRGGTSYVVKQPVVAIRPSLNWPARIVQ